MTLVSALSYLAIPNIQFRTNFIVLQNLAASLLTPREKELLPKRKFWEKIMNLSALHI